MKKSYTFPGPFRVRMDGRDFGTASGITFTIGEGNNSTVNHSITPQKRYEKEKKKVEKAYYRRLK